MIYDPKHEDKVMAVKISVPNNVYYCHHCALWGEPQLKIGKGTSHLLDPYCRTCGKLMWEALATNYRSVIKN